MRNKLQYLDRVLKNELDRALTIITPKMIEAFIKVYGEEHRDYITYTINNIHYTYFTPEKFMKLLMGDNLRSHDRYIINKYLKFLNKIKASQPKDLDKALYDLATSYLIKLDDETLFTISELELMVRDNDPFFSLDEEGGKNIFLPIYILDLKTIFHEINHALNTEAIALTEDRILSSSPFKNIRTEELVNDYIASLALQEYEKMQGSMVKELRRFEIYDIYVDNDYIVKPFFDALSPLILESLITRNHRLLWGLAGKENVDKFSLLAEKLYEQGYNDEDYDALIKLVDIMYEEVLSHDKPLDYEAFYQELEKNGCRIRRLKV